MPKAMVKRKSMTYNRRLGAGLPEDMTGTRAGEGFFGDAWRAVKGVGRSALKGIKKARIVSTALAASGHPVAGGVVGSLGWGAGRHGSGVIPGGIRAIRM